MKTGMLGDLLLSTFFYTVVLSTAFVMPLVLASHSEIDIPGVRTAQAAPEVQLESQVWDRTPTPAARPPVAVPRAPHPDPAATPRPPRRQAVDRSGPDSEMIRAGKVRMKTIKT